MKMNEEDKKSISLEEALQMPELAHLHDTMRYLENASDSRRSCCASRPAEDPSRRTSGR